MQFVLAELGAVELLDTFVSGVCLLEDETFFKASLDDVAFNDGVLDEGFCSITLEDEKPDIATSDEEMQEDEVSDDDKLVYDTEDDVYETAGAGSGAGALTLSSSQPVKNAAMINNVIGKIADALFE
ncbi:MAG: hypothetical protein J6Y14_02565 [Fibrobacter sp.]|nr:hypothetical protein [Fibrobacter sp.]